MLVQVAEQPLVPRMMATHDWGANQPLAAVVSEQGWVLGDSTCFESVSRKADHEARTDNDSPERPVTTRTADCERAESDD